MMIKPQSQFGINVKIALMQNQKTQKWLIDELKKETGLFVDGSLLYKVLTGKNNNPKLIIAIEKILHIKKEDI